MMQAKESDILFAKVYCAIEKGGNDLLWPSESDNPLEAIKLSKVDFLFEKASGAKWVKDKNPMDRLLNVNRQFVDTKYFDVWYDLIKLFWDAKDLSIYKVPVQSQMEEDLGYEPTEFRLYVLRDMGFYKVGFFTTLIET
jgi:hypothetical protein